MTDNKLHYCATIGFFDGVHRGHRQVIDRMKHIADEKGLQTLIVTFDNHPMEVIRPGFVPELLITPQEKINRLEATGVDRVLPLHFTIDTMQQPAREFMQHVLRDQLHVSVLVIGYDNRFGRRNPDETFETYVQYGRELGIEVIEGPRPEECGLFEGQAVSSTLIRTLMKEGRHDEALRLMRN